jgi:hypothetical protein
MPFPTPPPDNSGGFIVIKYSNGTYTHRMRLHVLSFNADATGTYAAPPAGGDASVTATATNVINTIKPWWPGDWTLSLDAVYANPAVGGTPVQVFTVTGAVSSAGTGAGTVPSAEAYGVFNFRTLNGHRARFFVFQQLGLGLPYAGIFRATDAASTPQAFVALLSSNTTAVVGHDGSKLAPSAHYVTGLNKRLRRRYGHA